MKIQLSFDDYHEDNIRLAELLMKYELQDRTIFFVECERPDQLKQIKQLHDWGFEIGSHTITHPPDLKLLPPELLRFEIQHSKHVIENEIKDTVNWFCYPKGKFNEKVKDHVKQARYKYARTVRVNKWYSPDPYEQDTTAHIYPRKEYRGDPFNIYADKVLNRIKDINDATFHLWGHSWEITKFNYWQQTEETIKLLSEF